MIVDAFNPRPEGSDRLEEGFYLLTMHRSGRVSVPIRIWFGPPEDPDFLTCADADSPSGQRYIPIAERVTFDRSPRWQVEINGVPFGDPDNPACIAGRPIDTLDEIWPRCARVLIDQREYEYRVARAVWAEAHDENDPFGGTGARVDPMTATLPFM